MAMLFFHTLGQAQQAQAELGNGWTIRPTTPDMLEDISAGLCDRLKYVLVEALVPLNRQKCAFCGTEQTATKMVCGGPGELLYCNEECLDADLDAMFERFHINPEDG